MLNEEKKIPSADQIFDFSQKTGSDEKLTFFRPTSKNLSETETNWANLRCSVNLHHDWVLFFFPIAIFVALACH